MHPSVVDALTISIRTCRYLAEATDLATRLLQLRELSHRTEFAEQADALEHYLNTIRELVASEGPTAELLAEAESTYHRLKNTTLQLMVRRDFSTALGDQALDALSSVRRLNDQWSKSLKWQPATEILNGVQHQLPESENLQ